MAEQMVYYWDNTMAVSKVQKMAEMKVVRLVAYLVAMMALPTVEL